MARRRKSSPLLRRAQQIVDASLPPVGTINRQYGRAISDAGGFTDALLAELRQGGAAVSGAYDDPIAQQRSIHDAAVAALGGLGPEYRGAGVATGAMGDSSATRMLESQAASGAYAAKLPGIAASRGELTKTGLLNAKTEALQTREEQRRAQLPSVLNQLQQQQFDRNMALRQFGLQQQSLNAQLGQQQADNAFRSQQAKVSQTQFRQQMIAQYGYDPSTSSFVGQHAQSMPAAFGMSPQEFQKFNEHTVTQMEDMISNGASFGQVLRRAETVTQHPAYAKALAMQVFANAPMPPKPQASQFQQFGAGGKVVGRDIAGWRAAQAQYNRRVMVIRWFRENMAKLLDQRQAASNAQHPGGSGARR